MIKTPKFDDAPPPVTPPEGLTPPAPPESPAAVPPLESPEIAAAIQRIVAKGRLTVVDARHALGLPEER